VTTLPEGHPTRRSQSASTRRYDRIARFYSTLEPLYLIFPPTRRKAVAALGLKAGDTVLEIGAGTGRNFPYLAEAVGPSGTIIGVDASEGMLAEARKLIERRGWSNVELLHQDATQPRSPRRRRGRSMGASPCRKRRATSEPRRGFARQSRGRPRYRNPRRRPGYGAAHGTSRSRLPRPRTGPRHGAGAPCCNRGADCR
jgi:hypothetical protein